jgi:hypothetical protein
VSRGGVKNQASAPRASNNVDTVSNANAALPLALTGYRGLPGYALIGAIRPPAPRSPLLPPAFPCPHGEA